MLISRTLHQTDRMKLLGQLEMKSQEVGEIIFAFSGMPLSFRDQIVMFQGKVLPPREQPFNHVDVNGLVISRRKDKRDTQSSHRALLRFGCGLFLMPDK